MNKSKILIQLLVVVFTIGNLFAQTKIAQTGFQFLSVKTDARAEGMGGAFTTMYGSSAGLSYNPAGIAEINGMLDVTFARMEWIANINYNSLNLAFSPQNGDYGVFGLSILTVDYGDDIIGTMVWDNNPGYIETGKLEANAMSVGLAYARSLTDKFSIGGQVKYVSQHLGKSLIPGKGVEKNLADVLAFDFGTVFKTGFKSLVFGMSVRNFSQEIKYETEEFQLPLTFKIGLSANVLDYIDGMPEDHSVMVSLDAAHPRSFGEYVNSGVEYQYKDLLFLRSGYISSQDVYGVTYGFGVNVYGFSIDYAYVPFDDFDSVNRFSLRYNY